jgi:hypothetical protein
MLTFSPGSTSDSGTVETWRPRRNFVPKEQVNQEQKVTRHGTY